MNRRQILTSVAIAAAVFCASGCGLCLRCGPTYTPPPPADIELLKIARFMSGSFDTGAQAAADADFHHITLEAAVIWPERRDGVWVYTEQAVAGRADRPYQQRVLHLERADEDAFDLHVLLLDDEARWVGAWRDPSRFAASSPAELREKLGCAIRMLRANVYTYTGETRAGDCPSELHGSSYATSGLSFTPSRIEAWERGWSADGRVVWGTPAPYIFRRAKP